MDAHRFALVAGLMLSLLSVSAGAQAIDTGVAGLFAYMNVGGPINLNTFYAVSQYQNNSGLYPSPAGPVNNQTNFVEGEVWFVGGEYGDAYQCNALPYLMMNGVTSNERAAGGAGNPVACTSTTGWGWSGGAWGDESVVNQIPSTGSADAVKVRVRVRADGWVMAYHNRGVSYGSRAYLLRWRSGGIGYNPGSVDDTLLGVAIQRTLQVIQASGARNLGFTYTPSMVSYYDFQYTNATQLLIFGRGAPSYTYSGYSYGFGFSPGPLQVVHASVSFRALDPDGAGNWCEFRMNNKIFGCISNAARLRAETDSYMYSDTIWNVNMTSIYTNGNPIPSCAAGAGTASWPGNPYMATTIDPVTFNITANQFSNVTSTCDEMKVAVMLYLH